jgi:hypothetical protein
MINTSRLPLVLILLAMISLGLPGLASGAAYNLHLTTDNGPDYTDMASFVRSVTEPWETPQDKCIAIWRWGRRGRRQTSNANEEGRLIWDPILHYNSYGTMNCGVISGLNIASFLQLGYRARYIQLGDHTVSEVSWDQGRTWHMLDSSMSFFCYNHAGQIASCQDILESHACALSEGKRSRDITISITARHSVVLTRDGMAGAVPRTSRWAINAPCSTGRRRIPMDFQSIAIRSTVALAGAIS